MKTRAVKDFCIRNAMVVTPNEVIKRGSVRIENGKIIRVSGIELHTGQYDIDAEGAYLLPGLIDMHSDSIEREIESRPGTYLATNIAIYELDKKLAAAGVTTIYHSVSFADEVIIVIRSLDVVESIIREIKRLRSSLLVKTKVHARYEITYTGGVPVIEGLVKEGLIDMISIMDHTPGQGQFKTEEQIRGYYGDRFGVEDSAIRNLVETRMAVREMHGLDNTKEMVRIARENHIPLASHDDDSGEKVRFVSEAGAVITEFPVSLEAIEAAKDCGISIALGSPNILRGYSHNRNLSARELLEKGFGDIVCSDYIPGTLIHALFTLSDLKIKTLPESAKLFSLNPAKALGLDMNTGSIEEGLDADLLLVKNEGEVPRVWKTFIEGKEGFSSCL